jgi:competence protein ComEA
MHHRLRDRTPAGFIPGCLDDVLTHLDSRFADLLIETDRAKSLRQNIPFIHAGTVFRENPTRFSEAVMNPGAQARRWHYPPVLAVWIAALACWALSAAASASDHRTASGPPSHNGPAGGIASAEAPVMIIAPARREGTVNINEASPDDLTRHLKGVGPVKAKAIVAYREQYGKFRTVGELADVKGIGPKTVERLRPLIRLE